MVTVVTVVAVVAVVASILSCFALAILRVSRISLVHSICDLLRMLLLSGVRGTFHNTRYYRLPGHISPRLLFLPFSPTPFDNPDPSTVLPGLKLSQLVQG